MGWFSWRGEGSGDTLQQGPGTGPIRNLSAGPVAAGQRKVFNLREGRFRLDTRKTFFTIRLVRQGNKLPRKVMDAPSPKEFKPGL